MQKTLLTISAAYNGGIDRWHRLRGRRTWTLGMEPVCLARGCHFSIAMATWLDKSPQVLRSLGLNTSDRHLVTRAIHARRLMNGIASHLLFPTLVPDADLPY